MLKNQRVVFFIDNFSAWAMLCKSSANEDDTRILIRSIQQVIEAFHIGAWFEWIESEANASDGPSRWESRPDSRASIVAMMNRLNIKRCSITCEKYNDRHHAKIVDESKRRLPTKG